MIFPVHTASDYDNHIYFTYYDDVGKLHHDTITTFKNYFYASSIGQNFLDKKLATKRYVEKFGDMKFEQKKFPHTYEADFSPAKRFILDNFYTEPVLPQCRQRVAFLDIENDYGSHICYEGEYPVTAISVYDNFTDKIYTFGWHPDLQWTDKENLTIVFRTEGEMIDTFLKFWDGMRYTVCSGWNISYDITYLCNRIEKTFGMAKLNMMSPFRRVIRKKTGEYKITGVNIVDYREAFIKFSDKHLPSTSLDYVANEETKEGKIKYPGDLKTLWKQDPRKYIGYNRQDVHLLKLIEDKNQFIPLMEQIASFGFINLEDSMKFSITIDNMIVQKAMSFGYVVKSKVFGDEVNPEVPDKIQGAYNYENLQYGFHRWILDMDATSMYPFIMMNLNISPETKDDKGPNIAGNRQRFTNKFKGVVPQILEWMFTERNKYTKLELEAIDSGDKEARMRNRNKSTSIKKILNSFYGVSASKYFRFYDRQIGEAVTLTGQKITKHAIKFISDMKYLVISGDSVGKNSRITMPDGKEKTIEKMWNDCSSDIEIREDGKEVKIYNDVPVLTSSENLKNVFSLPTCIIRHKVNKKMFRISLTNREYIDVTEDHSLIGLNDKWKFCEYKPTDKELKYAIVSSKIPNRRDNEINYTGNQQPGIFKKYNAPGYYKSKPTEIMNDISFVLIKKIEEIEYNDYVYDLSIPGYEKFYANDILVHNTDSVLFALDRDSNIEECKQIGKDVGKALDESLTPFCKKEFNIDKQNFHFKQEMIADAGIFLTKKHYATHNVNVKGKDVDEMDYKGLSLVRNETPKKCREYLKKIYEAFVKSHLEEEINIMVKEYREYIENAPYQEIMIPTSMSKDLEEYTKTTPIHVFGARYWDKYYAEKYGVSFHDTDRGKYIFVKVTNPEMEQTHVITIPDTVDKFSFDGIVIDYEAVLERLFYKALEEMNFIKRVEELRILINKNMSEREILFFIYNKMMKDNPDLFKLKKIKYNVIIRRYSRLWWDQYLDMRKIGITKEITSKYMIFVQQKVNLL